MKKRRHNYIVLLLLGCLFAAPYPLAYFFYLHPHWIVKETTNKGTLLNPPVAFKSLGKEAKWQLLLWNPGPCEQQCVALLDKLARIRLALGRHLYNVDLCLLLDTTAPSLTEDKLQVLHDADIHVSRLSSSERKNMTVFHDHLDIFIVNPKDYMVLAYQPTANAGDIFHDLKQLVTKQNGR